MREHDDIILELYSENVIVAVSGIGETPTAPLDRLVEGLRHAVEQIGPADLEERRAFAEPPPWGPLELAPRDAFLGPQEVVPFDAAEGRIAAESLAAYPPGVPNVLPGERLTAPDHRLHRRTRSPTAAWFAGRATAPCGRSGW